MWVIWYLSFCISLASLGVIISRFIHTDEAMYVFLEEMSIGFLSICWLSCLGFGFSRYWDDWACVIWIIIPCQLHHLQVFFSQYVGCLFVLLIVSFAVQKLLRLVRLHLGLPGGSAGKESACDVGRPGSIPGLGKSPGEGRGCPLQYSGLESSVDCVVHGVAKSRTRLSGFHFTFTSF